MVSVLILMKKKMDSDDNEYSEVSLDGETSDEETYASDEETPENTLESETVSLEREDSIIVLSD